MPHSQPLEEKLDLSGEIADSNIDSLKQVQIRLLVACPRSGSTLFMRIFRELPRCAVTSRLILQGNYHESGDESLAPVKPNYSIFSHPEAHPVYQEAISQDCTTLITKEELEHEYFEGECDFNIFPNKAAYDLTRPAFLVRDPVRVFDSWKKMGWGDLNSFFICYRGLFKMLKASPNPKSIIYEQLVSDPGRTVASLAEYWNILFDEDCLEFKKPFGDFIFKDDREQSIYQGAAPEGLFDRVKSHNHIKDFGSHGLLSALEIEHIETEVGSLYLEVFGSKLDSIRMMLSAKTWFGFDLDDTLHEFRKASGHASSSVFKAIAEKTPYVTTDELASTYRGILRSKTTGAFTDGRTSEEYRRERFSHLLQAHGSEPTEACLESLTAIYRDSLREALRLKAGSRQLLERLKSLDKKVIVVTEGPQDAQEWTISELGLQQYIDILITTNEVGKSKVDGLFDIVLDKYNIAASDIVYVGDNEQRDVAPAHLAGIMTVLYDEKSSCRFDDPQSFRINSLPKLGYLVS
ncbi:hypothetical protein N7513_010155 [Penicillium frequentans]|nr:hypothetical protein N7513_010155 [Penicillium glabrum]